MHRLRNILTTRNMRSKHIGKDVNDRIYFVTLTVKNWYYSSASKNSPIKVDEI